MDFKQLNPGASGSRRAIYAGTGRRLVFILLLGFALLSLAGPAAAQNSWLGLHPVNTLDFWSNSGEWSLGAVPDGSTDITIGFDDVGGDTSFTNRHTLTIGGPARLIVFSPTTITNSGTSGFINNSGTLLNNGTITNASSGTLNNIGVLSNNGTLFNELGAQLNNDLELDNNGSLVNRLSGTIVNTGNLNNNSGGLLTNDLSSTITNNYNLINASGGNISNFGTLNGTGTVVNLGTVDNFGSLKNVILNSGGTVNNNGGGSVQFADGSVVQGGTLNNAAGFLGVTGNGATVTLIGSSNFGAVTIKGTYTGDEGTTTNLLGTIINQGNVQVNNGGGFNTHLTLVSDTTLQGGGTITLANVGGTGSSFINAVGNGLLTNVDNTIQGAGTIADRFVNQAGGTINANVAGQELIIENNQPITNAGLMEATGGGLLRLTPSVTDTTGSIDNRGGTIAANGGGVLLIDMNTQGGTITALNGGSVGLLDLTVMGGTLNNVSGTLGTFGATSATLDGSTGFGAVTIQGTYTADAGSTTNLLGTITNQGNVQVNSGGGFNTHLTLVSDTTLQGGGTITLANVGGAGGSLIDAATNGLTLTNVGNTIQGLGTITGSGTGMQLVNQAGGTILSNAGGILAINAAPLTNAGTVQVNAGSSLQVIAPFTQTGGKTQVDGTLLAALGENVSGGTILGTGTLNGNVAMAGGAMQPGGLTTPGTLTINGDLNHSAALFEELIGSAGDGLLVLNGDLTLGPGSFLDIDLLDGFTPFAGETFTLMDFFSGTGTFENAPTTGFQLDGFNWTIEYNATNITLDAGSPVTEGGGGSGGGGNGGGTSVPEPSSIVLLGAGLLILTIYSRRKTAADAA